MSRRHFHIADDLWNELVEAAAYRTREEGTHISTAELLRRGALREIEEHYTPTTLYKHPRGLETLLQMKREG